METLRRLKTLFGTLVTLLTRVFENRKNMPDTFSDTPELPDTLPDTVLDTFYDFSNSYTRLGWPSINPCAL